MNPVTKAYKTRTGIAIRENPSLPDTWGIALDIGYSALKGMCPNKAFIFPSFAKKVSEAPSLGKAAETDIVLYDNLTHETWLVGESGQRLLDARLNQPIYGRNRYFDPMFRAIAAAGLGIGLAPNRHGDAEGKRLAVQTGLPPEYMDGDSQLLKEALAGDYDFAVKIGTGPMMGFRFRLQEGDIMVMPQPMGILCSIATGPDGRQLWDADKYFASNVLILDPGFGTLDIFDIRGRSRGLCKTYPEFGMRAVFERASKEIFHAYRTEVSVSALQNYLENGEVTVFDRKTRSTKAEPFEDILVGASRDVCMESLRAIDTIYENLVDYNYLVVTGGTGAAWYPLIREYYGGMSTLEIVAGNKNDTLGFAYANARGYYMFQYGKLARGAA